MQAVKWQDPRHPKRHKFGWSLPGCKDSIQVLDGRGRHYTYPTGAVELIPAKKNTECPFVKQVVHIDELTIALPQVSTTAPVKKKKKRSDSTPKRDTKSVKITRANDSTTSTAGTKKSSKRKTAG